MQAIAAAPAPLQTSLVGRHVAAGQMQRVDQTGDGDDGGAVLVVVKDRDIHRLAQPLLDDETVRRLDVLQIDAAEGWAELAHAIDEFVDVLGSNFQIDGIDIGKALEEHRLAFHHRLGGQGAQIAEAKDGGAVGDHRDHDCRATCSRKRATDRRRWR